MDWSKLIPDMSPALKRYYWRSVLPCVAFALLVLVRGPLLAMLPDPSPWRAALALLPLAGWLWLLGEYVRFLRECDELERRIELDALVAGTGAGVTTAMALLLLLDVHALRIGAEQVAGLAALVPVIVFALARHVLHRRYR